MNSFWLYMHKDLWIVLGDHHKTGLVLGVISMHFVIFS